jgi:peptidoglycan L-alanyl-D-glutamate endopeptidase CwlK
MGGFVFGERSRRNLVGVHPKLIKVAERALELTAVDFFVNEGVRTPARQKELYAQGRTKPGNKVTWTLNSNHFVNPRTGFGHAIDVYKAPYDPNQSLSTGTEIAKAFLRAADELDIPIRWGRDWDRDGNFGERGEGDSPHFELWGA